MTAENTKDDKAKCPAFVGEPGKVKERCDKDHRPPRSKMGDSKGSSTQLAANLEDSSGKPKNEHPYYDGGRTIAAHHLVSCQIFYAKGNTEEDNQFWEDVCHAYGYNINCAENGIFLPSKMYLACLLKKPLHRGNHDTTEVIEGDSIILNATYTTEVQALVEPIRAKVEKGEYCKHCEDFIIEMNDLSDIIKDYIISFAWTLTYDGRDYMPGGIGCCNFKSITVKLLVESVAKARGKQLKDITLAKLYTCNRNHDRKYKKP